MADFEFSINDLMSQSSDPFVRENMKNLAAPLNSSRSLLGANDFAGYATSSTSSVSSILLGAPIYNNPVSLQTSQEGLLSALLGASLPATKKSGAGLGAFDALVPTDIVLSSQQANNQARSDAIAAAAAASAASGTTTTPTTTGPDGNPTAPDGTPLTGQVAIAVSYARRQIGKPYVWGASGPDGYDCSGLIMQAYSAAGINLPRTTYGMVNAGIAVPDQASLIPGDLVLPDAGHVQLYSGNGNIIEAPHTGTVIREGPMWGFWKARRVATG